MTVRELRWWSTTALSALGAALEPAWLRWCAAWGVERSTVVAMNACEGSPADAGCAVEPLHGVEAWLCSGTRPMPDAVRGLLFGDIPASPASPLQEASMARDIAELAWTDLRARLTELALGGRRAPVVDTTLPPLSDFRPWSGAVLLNLSCSPAAAGGIVLHLSGTCAARLADAGPSTARPASSPNAQRWSVLEAMQDCKVPLRIGLDDVLLDVGTLGSLRCGDVLTLTHRLDQVLRVRVMETDPDAAHPDLCAAVLGARGGQRAVELVRARGSA